jgi:SAM-dependent methyltransferase
MATKSQIEGEGKSMSESINLGDFASRAYLLRLWFEKIAFSGYRLLALPTWLRFQATRPIHRMLSYADLLEMNCQYSTVQKSDDSPRQQKWAMRVVQLANIFQSQSILEVGCGHGLASRFVAKSGFRVAATDVVDVRSPEVKSSSVQFSIGDACTQLPYADNIFDLVFSVNSFEHFSDPQAAMDEILRVIRPGGILFLAFSPLYYSAWGLHAFRRLGMPYPQLLFSEETIQHFVDEEQARIAHTYDADSDKTKIGPYLNRYALDQYRQIFKQYSQSIRVWGYVENISLEGRKIIERYPAILKANVPTFNDLIVSGIKLVAQKK